MIEFEGLTHISKAGEKALQYIKGRREGTIKSLKTPLAKLNKVLLDGIEWNKILTIAGRSGG